MESQQRAVGEPGASSAAPALVCEGVGKIFPDGTEALADIDLTVHPGEFVTVVGPSGCGKSTLLKLVSGLLPHTSGSLDVDRDKIGYVFQDATLLPWRTVQKNVELLAELENVDAQERERLAAKAIELVGLSGFESHHPKRLSGGMRMRVSLARSLTLQPRLFLFDEPFGALDEMTRERLNSEVLDLFLSEGFAGLFITHSISEAVYLSTRVVVMSARPGRLVSEFAVPFDYPRVPELRFEPEFAKLSGDVSEALRAGYDS